MTEQERQFVDWVQSVRAWAKHNQEQMDQAAKCLMSDAYETAQRAHDRNIGVASGAMIAMAYFADNEACGRIIVALSDCET